MGLSVSGHCARIWPCGACWEDRWNEFFPPSMRFGILWDSLFLQANPAMWRLLEWLRGYWSSLLSVNPTAVSERWSCFRLDLQRYFDVSRLGGTQNQPVVKNCRLFNFLRPVYAEC